MRKSGALGIIRAFSRFSTFNRKRVWLWGLCVLIAAAPYAQPPDSLDAAVAARLAEYAAEGGAFYYVPVGQTVDERAGVVYLSPVLVETGEAIPGLIDLAPVVRSGRTWSVALPGDVGYHAVYSQISPVVLSRIDAQPYKPPADPALTDVQSLRSYRFPWVSGQWATVTRSYNRHGLGQIDFDLGAPEIAAMRDGTIVYANDQNTLNGYAEGAWWYWNSVVIEHAPHEFALYGHIAPSSIPGWIKESCSTDLSRANCAVPIRAGEIIGAEGSTGYSSNPHLHVEFGQRWGIAPYRDVRDQDRDGDRLETIFAPYVYAEHNVGFRGYAPADVGNLSLIHI
jgi:murein DD-endopeptidase MepM/ murein hydrolase activator NlpD